MFVKAVVIRNAAKPDRLKLLLMIIEDLGISQVFYFSGDQEKDLHPVFQQPVDGALLPAAGIGKNNQKQMLVIGKPLRGFGIFIDGSIQGSEVEIFISEEPFGGLLAATNGMGKRRYLRKPFFNSQSDISTLPVTASPKASQIFAG